MSSLSSAFCAYISEGFDIFVAGCLDDGSVRGAKKGSGGCLKVWSRDVYLGKLKCTYTYLLCAGTYWELSLC